MRAGLMRPLAVLGVVAALALAAPPRAPAQVRGVVTDATGRPLPGVLVELWDSGRRLAGNGTDPSGHFLLSALGTGRRAILARAIGLAFVRTETGDTAIAFCSHRGNGPYIRGRLMLSSDSTLASAEWEFVTPPPSEVAGGRVPFAPIAAGAVGEPVLPIAGLFWRKRLRGVYQEWTEYRQWERCVNQDCSLREPLK